MLCNCNLYELPVICQILTFRAIANKDKAQGINIQADLSLTTTSSEHTAYSYSNHCTTGIIVVILQNTKQNI